MEVNIEKKMKKSLMFRREPMYACADNHKHHRHQPVPTAPAAAILSAPDFLVADELALDATACASRYAACMSIMNACTSGLPLPWNSCVSGLTTGVGHPSCVSIPGGSVTVSCGALGGV